MAGSGQSKGYCGADVDRAVDRAVADANAKADADAARKEMEFKFAQSQQQAEAQLALQQAAHKADLAEACAQEAKRSRRDTEKMLEAARDHAARHEAQQQANFQSMMQQMRESKGEEITNLEQKLAALQVQMSADAEELKVHKDMGKYEEVQKTRFSSFLSHVRQAIDPPKTDKPSIAILGYRGVGKSSSCNALTGEEFAKTGCEDTTMLVTQVYGAFPNHKFEVWDVPGETDTRSYSNLEHLMKMKTMHVIIVQYTESIKMALNLIRLVAACRVPLIIVRNKVDMIQERDAKKEKMSLDDFRKHIQSNEEKTLIQYLREQDEDVGADDISIIFACTGDGPDGLGVSTIKKTITSVLGRDVF